MKRIFTILSAVLLTASVFAQTPNKMSYQAVVRDLSNNLVTNQAVGMKISILQGSISGASVYEEIFNPNPTTNANGLVTVEIGGGVPLSGNFTTIDWSAGSYFIKTETDPSGGTNYTITGVSQLLSVPYALHSKTAEAVTGGITETDPIFVASPANGIVTGDISNWNNSFSWGNHATAGYLTSFIETDALWTASPSFGITNTNISNWNTAFGWGNHATAGYLTSFTETDPIWSASPSFGITNTNVSNWNTAFGWGNHATAGYLTSFTETDPLWTASPSFGITNTNISNWNTVYSWGNHATAGYLTSITETDPLWTASPSFGITNINISNWNTAFGWGNHATAGYLTSFTETDPIWSAASSNYYTKTNMQTSGQALLHFNNLTNKPTTLSGYGITDAFDGQYSSLTGKPTNVSSFTNDAGYITSENQTLSISGSDLSISGGNTVSIPNNGDSFSSIQLFTSTSTWTCPSGISKVYVKLCGGGGGGGGRGEGNASSGGGGGGGAYVEGYLSVTPNTVYTITVGNGGSLGALNTGGGIGGVSSFSTLLSASGGNGGGGGYYSGGGGGAGGNGVANGSNLVISGEAGTSGGTSGASGGLGGKSFLSHNNWGKGGTGNNSTSTTGTVGFSGVVIIYW